MVSLRKSRSRHYVATNCNFLSTHPLRTFPPHWRLQLLTISFGGTTFVLSFFNAQARNVKHPNVILGLALGYGGLAQLIAGVEEWACGNTFGATAFTSYGSFWISFACFYIPQFEVTTAYASKSELDAALGIYLSMWG